MYNTPRLLEALVRDRVAEIRRAAQPARVAEQGNHELRRIADAAGQRSRSV